MIVADHPIMRDGLRLAVRGEVDMDVVGEATNETQAVLELQRCNPDVILIDLQSPQGAGLQTARAIRSLPCSIPIVTLSTFPAADGARPADGLETCRQVPKTASSQEILAQVRRLAGR
jgi:DNA-binding NarL/FixJ family response regulator